MKTFVQTRPEEKQTDFAKVVMSILLVPIVLSAAIATMFLSYMFVPLMMVLLVSSIVYWTIRLNKSQH